MADEDEDDARAEAVVGVVSSLAPGLQPAMIDKHSVAMKPRTAMELT
jgi:hypothetical protein